MLTLTACSSSSGDESPAAPRFSLPNVREGAPDVSFAPGKATVVNFWASWCTPCKKEMPAFERAFEEFGEEIDFIGVDTQDARAPAIKFLDERRITYPSGYDPEAALQRQFELRQGLPHTLFIDARGRVVDRVVGQVREDALAGKLRRLRSSEEDE